jgi:DNA-binding transcriptional regulator GbsR (MarR family)
MNDAIIDQFVDSWGAMGSFWGVNNSVARIHALLIISERPWCLDEISERLRISKSNASTSLKELRSWRVIRKILQPGDRREFYVCEPDAWEMLFNIMRERKRREFDPVLASVRATLSQVERHPAGVALDRLRQMEQMMTTFDRLGERVLASGDQARALITFVLGKL